MPIFRWERMKAKAIDAIQFDSLMQGDPNPACYALLQAVDNKSQWRDELVNLEKEAEDIVRMWDVRQCRKLIKIFPHIIPKRYHDRIPTVYMDNSLEWVVAY